MPFISHCHRCENRSTKANIIQWVNNIRKSINKHLCGPFEGSEIEKYLYISAQVYLDAYKYVGLHTLFMNGRFIPDEMFQQNAS